MSENDILWRAGPLPDHLSGPKWGTKYGERLGCRTTDVGGPRQDHPSGAEADRSGV